MKWFTAKLTETEKLQTDLYNIRINFSENTHPRFWECTVKDDKKKGVSFFQNHKKFFVVNVEKVIQIYRNNWVMTMNCFSKIEGQRELIQVFQNFMKGGPSERPVDRQFIKKSEYEKPTLIDLLRIV